MVALDIPNTELFPQIEAVSTSDKLHVLLLSIWYPLSISRYFERALRRIPHLDVIATGPYTGNWMPWLNGLTVPEKYAIPPELPLPFQPNVGKVSYDLVRANLPQDWHPDLILTVDAGICWIAKPNEGIVAHVATDPHVLNYDHQRQISDKFFNMQQCYSKPGDIYLPYAFDPTVHYVDRTWNEKDTDAVLIGMPYENRRHWVNSLRQHGVSVLFENGPIFDEYRELNNRAKIGLNWSSLNDLNARVFELMAMGLCPVINRVPDLGLFFEENTHYLGFSSLSEAVEKVLWVKNNPEEANNISELAHWKVWTVEMV